MTVPQVAQALGVTAHWLYNLMRRGVIEIERDASTRLYLFPTDPRRSLSSEGSRRAPSTT